MALLPVLLDMVDDIYTSLDDQSRNFSDSIPLLFVPQQRNCGSSTMNCHRGQSMNNCPRRSQTGCPRFNFRGKCGNRPCTKKQPSDEFQVTTDVKSFKPEEVTVKVKDRQIIVEGAHDEREDDFGFISRTFTRRYNLPEEFDPDTVSTYLSADGNLIIKAQKPKPIVAETSERVIPIQFVPATTTSSEDTVTKPEKVGESSTDEKKIEEPKE
jgi:HSP20 family molecular chaperone IbpA